MTNLGGEPAPVVLSSAGDPSPVHFHQSTMHAHQSTVTVIYRNRSTLGRCTDLCLASVAHVMPFPPLLWTRDSFNFRVPTDNTLPLEDLLSNI